MKLNQAILLQQYGKFQVEDVLNRDTLNLKTIWYQLITAKDALHGLLGKLARRPSENGHDLLCDCLDPTSAFTII